MKRLLLDHNKMRGAQRALQYARIERARGPHPTALELQRRPADINQDSRFARYARIDRARG